MPAGTERRLESALAAATSAAAWAEALRSSQPSLPELVQALLRPPSEARRMCDFAAGRAAWLDMVDSLAACHRRDGQAADVARGALRKALGLLGAHGAASLLLALVVVEAVSPGPRAAAAIVAPCTTLPLLAAVRHRHRAGLAALAAHSAGLGMMLGAVGPVLHWQLQQKAVGLLAMPSAAATCAAAAVAGVAMARALHGSDPDESMMVPIVASGTVQLAIYCLTVFLFLRPCLTAETLRLAYFCGLACACMVAAVAGVVALCAVRGMPPPGVEPEDVRCIVDQVPFGIVMLAEEDRVRVVGVRPGSAAERAGVRRGDVLVEVAGQTLLTGEEGPADARVGTIVRASAAFMRPVPFALKLQRL